MESAYKFLQSEINMEVTRGQLRLDLQRLRREINVALGVAGRSRRHGAIQHVGEDRESDRGGSFGQAVPVSTGTGRSSIAEMGNIITG